MNTFDFGAGPVPAHQHANGGGWVADTATVAPTAWIGPDARVSGNACVFDNAQVSGLGRSDGYAFNYLLCTDGVMRVFAGCRCFTMGEAREHWIKTRGGTPLGEETMIILDALEKIASI